MEASGPEDAGEERGLQHADLCSNCSHIFQHSILNGMPIPRTGRADGKDMFIHLADPSEIVAAAAEGCHICKCLTENGAPTQAIWYFITAGQEDDEYVLHMEVQDIAQKYNHTKNEPVMRLAKRSSIAKFHLFPTQERSKARDLGWAAMSKNWTGHHSSLDLARYWLEICRARHSTCRNTSAPNEYPTRLLHISDTLVYLVDTAKYTPDGPYATLSHCWGLQPFFVLTPDNKKLMESGISRDQFPRSFQDAMAVAQHLLIDWLWIDCYCILQGSSVESQLDWQHESNKMASVYANGLINIGVDHAENPYAGAFIERDSRVHKPFIVSWKVTESSDKVTYNIVRYDLEQIQKDIFNAKLSTRAWCVQERILCPRMLHFGSSQVHWECNESPWLCERFPTASATHWQTIIALQQSPFGLDRLLDSIRHMVQPKYYDRAVIPVFWSLIVQMYTRASLTYPQIDKLLAVTGIALQATSMFGDLYQWGLLRKTLPALFYWTNMSLRSEEYRYSESRLQKHKPQPEKRTIQAPSWSWASLDGEIEFAAPAVFQEAHYLMTCLFDCCDFLGMLSGIASNLALRGLVCLGRLLQPKFLSLKHGCSYIILHTFPAHDLRCAISSERSLMNPNKIAEYRVMPVLTYQHGFGGIILERMQDGTHSRIGTTWFGQSPAELQQEHVWCTTLRQTPPELLILV